MLLILVALALAVFGMIHLARTLEPGQRVVAWLVFVLAIVFVFWKLVQMGVLGRTPVALFSPRIAGGTANLFRPQYAVSHDGRFLCEAPFGSTPRF